MTKTTHRFPNHPVMIRLATVADEPALDFLAELDSSRPPVGPTLIAERDSQAVAALALTDGAVIAHPFLPSGDVVALLRLRARQVAPSPAPGPSKGLARWTAAPRKPIRHAGDWLHRVLERPHVTIQQLNRRQEAVEHRR
jgi:hypothetical protein